MLTIGNDLNKVTIYELSLGFKNPHPKSPLTPLYERGARGDFFRECRMQ